MEAEEVTLKNIVEVSPRLGRSFGSMILWGEKKTLCLFEIFAMGLQLLSWHHGWKQAPTNLPCKHSKIFLILIN